MAILTQSLSPSSSDTKLKKSLCDEEKQWLEFLKTKVPRHDIAFYTEPINCLDPDDLTTYDYFLKKRNYFVRNLFNDGNGYKHPQAPRGEKICGSSLFELYNIEITKIDSIRYFSMIFMHSYSTNYVPVIIYQRPEGEKITLNKPLPLKNLFRPPDVQDHATISLSNPADMGWYFQHSAHASMNDDTIVYGRFTHMEKDCITDSEARITYDVMESAAIQILSGGTISATNNGDPFTKRLVRHFSSPLLLLPKKKTGVDLQVDRCTFGIPTGQQQKLEVYVELKYLVGEQGPYVMDKTLSFKVPKYTTSKNKCVFGDVDGNVRLSVDVSWKNRMW